MVSKLQSPLWWLSCAPGRSKGGGEVVAGLAAAQLGALSARGRGLFERGRSGGGGRGGGEVGVLGGAGGGHGGGEVFFGGGGGGLGEPDRGAAGGFGDFLGDPF